MSSISQVLARNLRRARLERALSLSALAEMAGLSKATLSGLERGRGNPSIDTVWALAQALRVPFGALCEDSELDRRPTVTRLADAPLVSEEPGFRGRRLSARSPRGVLEVYILELEQGFERIAAPHSPGVIEHVIGMSGSAEVGPEGEAILLQPGDSVSFAADRPHRYRALTKSARLLSLTDYPGAEQARS